MKHLWQQWRFYILVTVFLTGLLLLTMPVSSAVWREVLGVSADVDAAYESTPTPLIVSPTPILTLPALSSPTAILPSLEGVIHTIVPDITMPSPTMDNPEIPTAAPADSPSEPPPTISTPTDLPSPELPPSENSVIAETPTPGG